MFRNRNWLNFMWGRPRNTHSLDNLKYLYTVLVRNHTVSEQNRSLLVETLRQIAEILIWGDQNDSSVFDFFLEKNMLSFFLRIMEQRNGGSSYLCVQLLQTLNILFENIRNETSLYYLLSNNYVNSIILHKFDFSDEEVMAYYISFLKTLSLKLNIHTIHFFYNEHTNDFPLYTEAIKFFNHSESMVRIAVRTLTLNIYKVQDKNMLNFIRDRTAAPYFSNIVSFIVKHILELDYCVQNYSDHNSRNRVRDLVAVHLDYLHYLNDILLLKIDDLNSVLINYLLNELLIPFYIYSIVYKDNRDENQNVAKQLSAISLSASVLDSPKTSESFRISYTVALFLLSQVFLIISHDSLIMILNYLLLKCDKSIFEHDLDDLTNKLLHSNPINDELINDQIKNFSFTSTSDTFKVNKTDEEKLVTDVSKSSDEIGSYRMFIEVIISSVGYTENDQVPLLALCLIYAIFNNACVPKQLIERIFYVYKEDKSELVYNKTIVDHLLNIVTNACQDKSKIRPITLELALKVTQQIVCKKELLTEEHKAILYAARAQCMATLRDLYNQEMFLDMFEYEYHEMSSNRILNVEYLCMDSAILLPPTGTPLTGIDFVKRLPCGEVEKSRKSIRTYFLMRKFYLELSGDMETQLPLVHLESCIKVDDILNLENKDLIACTIVLKNGQRTPRFIAFDAIQVIIVEPESSLGVGKAKLVGFLQDVEVVGDKDDYCALYVTIHRPLMNNMLSRKPLLSAKFVFQDHIRCIAARQHLLMGRKKAREKKLQDISQILEISSQIDFQKVHKYSDYNSMLKVSSRNFGRVFNEHLNFLTFNNQPKNFVLNTGVDVMKTDLAESSKQKQYSRENSLTRLRNRERSKSRSKSRESSPRKLPNSEIFQMLRTTSSNISNQCDYSGTISAKNISTVSEETSFISENSSS